MSLSQQLQRPINRKFRVWLRWLPPRSKARAEAPALLLITAFFAIFFWPTTLTGKFLIVSDALLYSYPLRIVAWEAIRHGSLPLWTPLVLSGYPLLSMAQLGLGYPLTWSYLFFPPLIAEQIYILAPFLLSPFFTYAYARELGRSRLASLLAGLSFTFGGMMTGGLAHNGLLTNAVMWLPLLLLMIERARQRRFIPCLLGATGAYAMSVLTGVGQGFLYAGLVAIGYAVFVSLLSLDTLSSSARLESARPGWQNLFEWKRWKPLAVCVGGMMLAASIAAFQILETLRAQRRSIRGTLTYELFSHGSFTPRMTWQSFLSPYHNFNWEASTYFAPLAALLALIAVIAALRAPRSNVRVFFWSAVAVLAWLLILGNHTPLHQIAYQIPFLNSFRVPWRHTFELTFALAILAAYGWDALQLFLARRPNAASRHRRRDLAVGISLLVGAALVGFGWWRAASIYPLSRDASLYPALSESAWLWWKASFTLLICFAIWWGWQLHAARWRAGLLAGAVMLACFLEAQLMVSFWWFAYSKPAAYYAQVSSPSRFLQRYPPEENRIYTSVARGSEMDLSRAEPPNITALRGLHNAAGYEPLMLERYSRAFGQERSFFTPTFSHPSQTLLLDPGWRVLDLLNVKFLVEYSAPAAEADARAVEKDGVKFASTDLNLDLKPGQSVTLTGARHEVDRLSVVSVLANSVHLIEGTPVAKITFHTTDGRNLERALRAGQDTAEWAYDSAAVRAAIKHSRARVFDSHPSDTPESFPVHRYWSCFALDEKVLVDRVEITNLTQEVPIAISKAALFDSTSGQTWPLTLRIPEHWEKVYDQDQAQIYLNQKALPRAWLVAKAEAVDSEEALRRITGESKQAFDPLTTVLLEVDPQKLRGLQGGSVGAEAGARVISYEPNRLVIETKAAQPSVLVVSEINYPGWTALVDDKKAEIQAANYLLRGVILPEGRHRVEMRYMAPAARNGAIIGALALFLICVLAKVSSSMNRVKQSQAR